MPSKTKTSPDTTPAGGLTEVELQQLVGYQLAQATITTNDVFTRHVGKPLGLRRVEYTLLMLIKENPGCSASRLARALDLTAPNIAMWVAHLEEQGWVKREQSETDRRAQHLRLSPKGERLASETTLRLIAGEREALSRLSFGERAILIELLHKVACSRPV
jgi:DNA-binding MarR family transcriptional regulator